MRLLTPPGLSGVAVVAFDGDERGAVAAGLRTPAGTAFDLGRGGAGPRRARLQLDGRDLDQVLVVDRPEHGLELHLHGSPAVVRALAARFPLRAAAVLGPAERLLRTALAPEQLDLALEQRVVDFAAFCAGLAALPAAARAGQVAAARARSRVARAHCVPAVVVLAGAQNAGKSTLFNRLLFRERALTGARPGLTRDPVREVTTLCGYPFELVDTAGEGEAASTIDAAAIERGRALRAGACVLLVVDLARGIGAVERTVLAAVPGALVVANKADLPPACWAADVPCALRIAAARDEPAAVRRALGELLRVHRGLPPAGPVGGPAALDDAGLAALDALAR
jgi:small GTP-binding protein